MDRKHEICSMEYSNLFNAKDLIDGILRGRGKYLKDERTSNENNKRSRTNKLQIGPSDKAPERIGDILRKLNKFSTAFPGSKPYDLNTEKKRYFQIKPDQETKRNILQIFRATGMPSKINKQSTTSAKIQNNKKNLGTISKPCSANTINSNPLVRKGPVLKSKLENFKDKIVLSADAIVETVEKSWSQDRNSAFIDTGSVGTQSQLSVGFEDIPRIKKTTETNTFNSNVRAVSEVECLTKLSALLKKVFIDRKYNAGKINRPKIRRLVNIDTSPNKKKNASKSFVELTHKTECKKATKCDHNYEKNPIISNNMVSSRNITQTPKTSCNSKPMLQFPKRPQRNSLLKANSSLIKSKVNLPSNKISSKNQLNFKESNKSVKSKQNDNENSHLNEDGVRTNQTKRKSKTRSNTTLNGNISDVDDWNMNNYVCTEPSLLKRDSTTSSIKSGVKRGSSLMDSRNKTLALPKRATSFITPKLKEKIETGRKASSFSSLYGNNSTLKNDKFRVNMVKQVQEEVATAIENKKTFTICGDYPAVRKALKSRGWVEKYDTTTTEKLEKEIMLSNQRSFSEAKNIQREKNQVDICKRLLQSKLLANHQVDLYWVANILEVDFDKIETTKINKFNNDIFSNRDGHGLSSTIKNADCFNFPGLANIRHPRTYVLNKNEEILDFIKDFRLTAAISLLKWVIRTNKKGNCKIISCSGNIPLKVFQFATNECFKKVMAASNSDIEQPLSEASDTDWNEFLEYYYNIIHIGHHFESSNLETESSMTEKATYVIEKLAPLYPNIEMDGIMNIWILKPTQNVKEKGIHICRTLEYIMKTAKNEDNVSYAVQKYIERPLLIFNNKFDIRQWFLISSTFPLTIWMYKECYLRFSSQTHNLKKLHQSIHPSAHYVPKQFQNIARNITLPNYNMWDSQQFRNYLSSIGLSEVYSEITYKGMKECVIWAVLVHQEKMYKRKNSFELFEVDFMITEDFQPWLIEIHPNPALKSTNPVTSRLCSRVIEDTIKVVVDRAENPKADTGNFEMIYKQSNMSSKSECDLRDFKAFREQPDNYFDSNWDKIQNENKQNEENQIETKSETNGLTETLESLLKFIRTEKKKRDTKKLVTAATDPIKSFDKVENKRSSEFQRSRRLSFKNLKSQLDMLTGYGDISMPEEDKNMIGYALKMLRNRNNDEVIRYLIEIIENILKRTNQEKKKTRGSVFEEMKLRMLSAPKRVSSSISSKVSNGKKISSHSYINANSTTGRLNNPLKQLREEVNRAIAEKKTFTLRGNHTAVRKALLKRGWVERFHISNTEKLESQMNWLRRRSVNELQDMMHVKELNDICKRLIKSKLLVNHQVDLYWGPNYDSFTINPDNVKLTKINKFRRDVFSYTSKQGLCDAAKDAHWFNFPGLANIKHPRTYVLTRDGETNDFIKDFRHTAAISLLKWVMRSHETNDCKIVSSSGKVPLEVFQFAVNECCKLIIEANNEDIDQPLKQASDHEWNQFLEYYYKILHIGNHFKLTNLETEETIIDKSAFLLKKLSPHYPHIRMDGTMNIWILKPAVGSQGKGIHICRTLQYILKTVKNNNNIKYIAQKYIERPLLIFNTKFDIRQWFLISSALPLTIWMYKECYLRFSSQTYNLRKLHESIHLTNNSVQQRYQNTSRDLTLPNYNMWDSQQFKNYLSNIGFPEVYHEVTYKGMKECIIGAVLIHQDKIDKRKNSFELYGADFMLTEDFQPWLIEINSSPALYASTPVTSRMCPQVLEDTIKVVVDYATNPKAKTGNFELIYKQENISDKSNVCVKDLKVSGKPLPRNYFYSDEEKKEDIGAVMDKLQKDLESPMKEPETVNRGVRETLENLLKFIHNEKKRRQKTKLIAKGTDPINPIDKSGKGMRSSTTCTNRTKSIASLKSQWDQLSGNGSFSVAKEDVSMIDKALSMLKETQNGEIIGYLLEVIEKILTRTQQNRIDS
ncbi:hypothetical protein WA026_001079 [Henosepilachna vigintioctopunctata]|uniref:Tubulin glycylase 3A n=1 Tax=Henosepilachna vigintioctopunctata TaxID=420089 RepID=A0AAW1V978_9CUCU